MLVDLYMAGKLKLDELVSRTFSLEEINTAFDVLDRGEVARSIIRLRWTPSLRQPEGQIKRVSHPYARFHHA